MEQSTSIAAMQKFHFGKKIFCSDGEEGVLTHVGFAPATFRMTHIGVKQGRPFGKTVYLPFDTVVNATGDGVTLRIARAELATASSSTPPGVIFDSKSPVENEGARGAKDKGTLLLIAVHPDSGEIAYLVVHHLRQGQDTLLRREFVTRLETGRIVVSVPAATLQTLPPYRPDRELQQEVESILFDQAALHVDLKGMTIRVLDSVLYLSGNISSSLRRDIAQDQAAGVPGLLEINNQLIADDTLAGDVAMALGRDARTRDLPIGVYPRLGLVRLSGAVHTPQQKVAAEEIARQFPGVRSVVSDFVVNPHEDMIRVMSSSEGGEADDLIPGKYIRHTR